jgi:hypothetical protein
MTTAFELFPLVMVRAGAKVPLTPTLRARLSTALKSKVGEAIADLARHYALLNEVGEQQRQPNTEHNHDHRRHTAPPSMRARR